MIDRLIGNKHQPRHGCPPSDVPIHKLIVASGVHSRDVLLVKVPEMIAMEPQRDQNSSVAPVQTIERQRCHLRLAGPGRPEFGAERHDQ